MNGDSFIICVIGNSCGVIGKFSGHVYMCASVYILL